MDKRQLASYAYHNCEFTLAIEIVRSAAPCAVRATIDVKSLCELDDGRAAVERAATYLAVHPACGPLHYALGIARYLAGHARDAVEAAFLDAGRAGFVGGAIGQGFLAASAGDFDGAVALFESVAPEDSEVEHGRRLSLFQTHVLAQRLDRAEAELEAADRVLSRNPSLLRGYIGELCWVRLFQARGRFAAAAALVDRMCAQLDETCAPLLFRNVREVRRMIEAQSRDPNIILPKERPQAVAAAALAQIGKKPMLHSLFRYLVQQGGSGATKECIVQNVWDERYNPMVHDDRIYKAVGRLRRILGDDQQAPKLLTQSGRHYVLTIPDAVPGVGGEP